MFDKIAKAIKTMELEEQILHAGVLVCAIGVCFPWFGGQWFGKEQLWTGFGFYTAYIGFFVFVIQLFILAITISPMTGGPVIIRKSLRNIVRLSLSAVSVLLLAAVFTVLLRVTFDVSGAEIRWGIYLCLIGSVVSLMYAFLRYKQQLRSQVREVFVHPDERPKQGAPSMTEPENVPPPPPPPPPMPPEDHTLYSPHNE